MKKIFKVALLLLTMIFMISQVWAGTINTNIQIYSGDPTSPASVAKSMETLFVSMDGLKPFARYNIQILSKGGILIAEYTLNATVDGKLPTTPMWPEAGLPPVGHDGGPVNPIADMQLGTYMLTITGPNMNVTYPFTVVQNNLPTIWSSNNAGQSINGFRNATDTVYATGYGFIANKYVNIYIIRDKDVWSTGDILKDPKIYVKTVTALTSSLGTLGPVDLGLAAIDTIHGNCTNFDIVIDANQNGIFDDGDAVDHRYAAGYTVQMPPDPNNLKFQLASNGHAVDYSLHFDATFYYPDTFNHDGSDTGFPGGGYFGTGVFCILNPLIDDTDPNIQLVENSYVQIWVITLNDFNNLANDGYNLMGKDVSDSQGQPDLVTVQRTCSNGSGSILIWSAPLEDRRGNPYVPGTGYVVIVEKPDEYGLFDNIYDPNADYVDGVLNSGTIPANQGFSVVAP